MAHIRILRPNLLPTLFLLINLVLLARTQTEEITKQIVLPSIRDSRGRVITENLKENLQDPIHPRFRRNSDRDSEEVFQLNLGTPDLELEVRHLNRFTSPRASIEWVEGNVTLKERIDKECVFEAKLKNATNSFGVVNLCRGVSGIVSTASEDVSIEPAGPASGPVNGPASGQGYHRPHVLTRKHKLLPGSPTSPPHETDYGRANAPAESPGAPSDHLCGVKDSKENTVVPDSPRTRNRQRRGIYDRQTKYMEVLVATDNTVVNFHGRDLIEQYLLTQMYIVNTVYQHESLGLDIDIVVTKIITMDDRTAESLVTEGNAKYTLDKFCQWSHYQMPALYPIEEEFDISVFITRRDIGPAGYAPVTGMCNPVRSCIVAKDDGISSAFVIAHEIGHVFGMHHDGLGNDCDSDASDGKVMAAMVQSSYDMYYWTECSVDRMQHYIGHLFCLNDLPEETDYPELSEPYGQSWSLDEQCRQEFGADFRMCRAFGNVDPCEYLWCSMIQTPMLCKTKRGPPLPGTECAPGRWCMEGTCRYKDGASRDGGWSSWAEWAECSQSCGTGVRFRGRRCDNPTPVGSGDKCPGEKFDVSLCNSQPCPDGNVDLRAEQCSYWDSYLQVDNQLHTWLPADNPKVSLLCRLSCMSRETGEVITSNDDVIDGTLCSYSEPYDVCINGICQDMGCDGMRNSGVEEDRCGVCGGDSSSCRTVTGTFTGYLEKTGYWKIFDVPTSARNMLVKLEGARVGRFLAVRNGYNSEAGIIINGGGHQGYSQQVVIDGVRVVYARTSTGDSLSTRGSLLTPLIIEVYAEADPSPVEVRYQYDFANALITQLSNENIYGYRVDGDSFDNDYVPFQPTFTVTMAPSPTTSPPSPPSPTSKPTKYDHRLEENLVTDDEDDVDSTSDVHHSDVKPVGKEPATSLDNNIGTVLEPYFWQRTGWTECSITCGRGEQLPVFECVDENTGERVVESTCMGYSKPELPARECDKGPCLRWESADWEECTRTCGQFGLQERPLYCITDYYGDPVAVDSAYCDHTQMPEFVRPCNRFSCLADWYREPWTPCSVSCGGGKRYRHVYCDIPKDGDLYHCNETERPIIERECNQYICPPPTTTTTPVTDVPTTQFSSQGETTTTTAKIETLGISHGRTNNVNSVDEVHSESSRESHPPRGQQSEMVTNPTGQFPSSTLAHTTEPTPWNTSPTHIPETAYDYMVESTTTSPKEHITTMTTTTPATTTRSIPPRRRLRPIRRGKSKKSKSNQKDADSAAACRGDKSFFCRLGVNKRNCLLHLYSTMCCGSCKKFI